MKPSTIKSMSQIIAVSGVTILVIAKIAIQQPDWQGKLEGMVSDFLTNPNNQAAATKTPGASEVVFAIAGLFAVACIVLREKK